MKSILLYTNAFEPGRMLVDFESRVIRTVAKNIFQNDDITGIIGVVSATHLGHHDDFFPWISQLRWDHVILVVAFDWEISNCIPERQRALDFIYKNSKNVHICGNAGSDYYLWMCGIAFPKKFKSVLEYHDTPEFNKHFMCLNRKPHDHRIALFDRLADFDLIQHGYVSMDYSEQSRHSDLLPRTLENDVIGEIAESETHNLPNDIFSCGPVDLWRKHFLTVVTETVHHTNIMISEKTIKPIIGKRPFVIIGDQYIHAKLRDMGFNIFDDLFDLSWDNNPNYMSRIEGAANAVKEVCSWSLDECQSVYESITGRLNHNYFHLFEMQRQHESDLANLFKSGDLIPTPRILLPPAIKPIKRRL